MGMQGVGVDEKRRWFERREHVYEDVYVICVDGTWVSGVSGWHRQVLGV